jgi:hypothetical protein
MCQAKDVAFATEFGGFAPGWSMQRRGPGTDSLVRQGTYFAHFGLEPPPMNWRSA